MKKTIFLATIVGMAASAVSAVALDNVTMLGADTLRDFTLNLLTNEVCPGAFQSQLQSARGPLAQRFQPHASTTDRLGHGAGHPRAHCVAADGSDVITSGEGR